ncbi:hypothetical protein N9D61_09540 [Planktomarina sp.]|nr:hypothetical protein [Planktomarina sp.]
MYDIIDAAHRAGPITDQHVAAGGLDINRMAGYSQHLANLVEGLAGGGEGAQFCRSFHNHHRLTQARDQAVGF